MRRRFRERLAELGIEADGEPAVRGDERGRRMLLAACRKHCNIAVLVAGDEDYVPLVEAVRRDGLLVYVWFVPDGVSPKLARAADRYSDISSRFM